MISSRSSFSANWRALSREHQWLVGLGVALAAYCAMMGVALLTGRIAPQRASLVLALVPATLALWYAYGFLQPGQPGHGMTAISASAQSSPASSAPDFGLLLSSAGWALCTLSLLIPSSGTPTAAYTITGAATPAANSSDMTAAVCGVLAVLCIGCGAVLSLRTWNERRTLNS